MASHAYKCPPAVSPGDREKVKKDKADAILAWCKRTRNQGNAWLQSQRMYREIETAINLLTDDQMDDSELDDRMSNVTLGEIRRNSRETTETLANLKALSSIKTDNPDYAGPTAQLNRVDNAWFQSTKPADKIKGVLQYAFAGGTGYAVQEWDPDFHGKGRGDVAIRVKGPHQVLPVQLPDDHDIQKAYAVHILTEMPIANAHKKFWQHEEIITSDRDTPSWMMKAMNKLNRLMGPYLSPVLNVLGPDGSKSNAADPLFPTVDIYYTYVDDNAINQTGATVMMGEEGASWSYTVPSMGSQVPSGVNNLDGTPAMRAATMEDCRLYPNRRLLIWCGGGILYDGPSYWWHGEVPAVPFWLDKDVWNAIGTPGTKGVASLERSANRVMRAIDDSVVCRIDPTLVANEAAFSETAAEEFNPRIAGQLLRGNMSMGKLIEPLLPPEYYDLPAEVYNWPNFLVERIKRNMATLDVAAMARAQQTPGADTLEKIQEMSGPILMGMTNSVERSLQAMGKQRIWLMLQFYTVQRRMQILGSDGITEEDLDFDPGSIVPSHLPDETDKTKDSRASRMERAKLFGMKFYFHVVPGSLHQITTMTQRLMYLQLMKLGFPIDWWTIAEVFNIKDFGARPKVEQGQPDTVLSRHTAQQRMLEEAAGRMAKQVEGAEPGGSGNPPGRPNSFTAAPHLEGKDGGTRTTMATS